MHLLVGHDWAGEPLPADQIATVTLRGGASLEVHVDAPLAGDPPPPGPPGPTEALWEHEVVELFILGADARYLEVELGPWGHHLVLQLHGVRQATARLLPAELEVQRSGGRWRGVARLDWGLVPPGPHRVNAVAVRGVGAARRWLSAVPLPGPRPDFHQLQRFLPAALPDRG